MNSTVTYRVHTNITMWMNNHYLTPVTLGVFSNTMSELVIAVQLLLTEFIRILKSHSSEVRNISVQISGNLITPVWFQ